MTKKELNEEIEFVHRNGRYVHRLIRSFDVMQLIHTQIYLHL